MSKIENTLRNLASVVSVAILITGIVFTSLDLRAQESAVGRETGLPLPRFVSIKNGEAHMRRGPSLDYPIEWIYQRANFPVQIIGESGHWRKVATPEGDSGWFHYSLLSGKRTALVLAERINLASVPSETAQIEAILEKGVIGTIESCEINWCEIDFTFDETSYRGWLPKTQFWGAGADEVFGSSS